MLIDGQEDIDQQAHAAQVTQDHRDIVHVSHHHYTSYHTTSYFLLLYTAVCSGSYSCQNSGTCVQPNTCCCLRTGYTGSVCNTGMDTAIFYSI